MGGAPPPVMIDAGAEQALAGRRRELTVLLALAGELSGANQFTSGDLARLERTRLLLAVRGIPLRDPRAAFWLAPVLCTSPSQQARFFERFAALFDVAAEDLRPAAPDLPVIFDRPALPWWRRRWRWIAMALVLGAVAGWLAWQRPGLIGQPPTFTSQFTTVLVSIVSPRSAPENPSTTIPWLVIAAAALLFFVAAVVLRRIWARIRRRRASRDFTPDHWESRNLAFAAALPALYGSPRLRHRLGGLRRHRAMPSPRIHVGRSIRATIKAGGRPVLRYGTRPQTPDYVLLADRESPRDHLPVVAQVLSRRFAEEGVAATAYDYFGDPRRVRQTFPVSDDAELSIERVGSRHACARLLVLAEPGHCLDASGRAAGWLGTLPEERPILLNPRREGNWDWREAQLGEAGVRIYPASPDGIVDYAEALQAAADEFHQPRRGGGAATADLPMLLERHRAALLDETAPDPAETADFLADLELWLGAEAMTVLRAAAVFPLVEPALTVLLASRLEDQAGKALLTEERLLALARLPWLRAGRMPSWLRGALARGLTPGQLAVTLGTIQAFLNPVADGPRGRLKLDFSQADDPAARRRLLEWLRGNPDSAYNDPLLLDALDDRAPEELGQERDPAPAHLIGKAIQAIDAKRDGVILVVTLVLACGLLALPDRATRPKAQEQQKQEAVPQPTPTSPPPTPMPTPMPTPPADGPVDSPSTSQSRQQLTARQLEARRADLVRRLAQADAEYRRQLRQFAADQERIERFRAARDAERARLGTQQQLDATPPRGEVNAPPRQDVPDVAGVASGQRRLQVSRTGHQMVAGYAVLGSPLDFTVPAAREGTAGSYAEVARAIRLFRSEGGELIAIDVSGRGDRVAALTDIVRRLAEAGIPNSAIAPNTGPVDDGQEGVRILIRVLCRAGGAAEPDKSVVPLRCSGR